MEFTKEDMIGVAMCRKENQSRGKRLFIIIWPVVGIALLLTTFGGVIGFGFAVALVVAWGLWFLIRLNKSAGLNKIEGSALYDKLPDDMKG